MDPLVERWERDNLKEQSQQLQVISLIPMGDHEVKKNIVTGSFFYYFIRSSLRMGKKAGVVSR